MSGGIEVGTFDGKGAGWDVEEMLSVNKEKASSFKHLHSQLAMESHLFSLLGIVQLPVVFQ